MSASSSLLSIAGLSKSYGRVQVLRNVDFQLCRGEVHALVGENGAGKSTLSRIIAGLTFPDAGAMEFDGQPYAPKDKRESVRRGIRMVMQELNLVSTLTVAESIFIERLPHRWGWIDSPELHRQARLALERVGLGDLNPARQVGTLGIGQQQLVEIAAGLSRRCAILILDEPTAALTDPEIDRLFARIAELKAAGTAILYISHRMEEIRRIADRISVLRDGRMMATRPARDWSLDDIVRLMVGRELGELGRRSPHLTGAVAIRVNGLRRGPAVRDVSFEVRSGEILGFAGLMGAGRTEVMRTLFGADRPDAGQVHLRGESRPVTIRSPRDAVRQGIAFLTEDRKEQGLLLPLTIRANTTLPSLGRFGNWGGWIRHRQEATEASRWIRTLGVRCRDPEQPVAELSGGNQQKVVIAKWLLRDCDVLIFDEPTRGIDVGAKFEIYQWLHQLAARGKAIIVISSDLKELIGLADRIAVMSAGRLVATVARGEWTQEQIMAAALSGYLSRD